MRAKLLLAAAAAALVVGMIPAPAGADTATVTANIVGLTGTRTFALAEALTGVNLVAAGGNSNAISGAFTATVNETAVAGDSNGYSVTAALTDLTSGTDTIANSNVLHTPGTMIPSLAGTDAPGTAGNFSGTTARSVWANSGQSASSFYTFLHSNTSTLGLTLPNDAKSGTYSGTLTVTFVA